MSSRLFLYLFSCTCIDSLKDLHPSMCVVITSYPSWSHLMILVSFSHLFNRTLTWTSATQPLSHQENFSGLCFSIRLWLMCSVPIQYASLNFSQRNSSDIECVCWWYLSNTVADCLNYFFQWKTAPRMDCYILRWWERQRSRWSFFICLWHIRQEGGAAQGGCRCWWCQCSTGDASDQSSLRSVLDTFNSFYIFLSEWRAKLKERIVLSDYHRILHPIERFILIIYVSNLLKLIFLQTNWSTTR